MVHGRMGEVSTLTPNLITVLYFCLCFNSGSLTFAALIESWHGNCPPTSFIESSFGSMEHKHVMWAWRKGDTFEMSGDSRHSFDKKAAWGRLFVFIKCFIRICSKAGPSRLISVWTTKDERIPILSTYMATAVFQALHVLSSSCHP